MTQPLSNASQEILASLSMTNGQSADTQPPEITRLAHALMRIHGTVHLANEESGVHIYMASPVRLVMDGKSEIFKRHLAVNASRYFGHREYADMSPKKREKCAMCMKSKTPFKVEDLLRMQPIHVRLGIKDEGEGQVISNLKPRHEIPDANGVMIPDHPGLVTPLDQLDKNHPAIFYLNSRGFTNMSALVKQFGAAFCDQEAPIDEEINRFYRKLHAGWRDTPQGRIVFHGYIRGVRRFWQARFLEVNQGDYHYCWHPYHNEWMLTEVRRGPGEPWELVAPFNEPIINGNGEEVDWKPRKYINGVGCQRAEWGLFGFDSAVAWRRERSKRFAVLCEGPPDAARFFGPGIAGAGSYLSTTQAKLIASEFPTVVLAYDVDKAGVNGRDVARRVLAAEGVRLFDIEPTPGMDFGAMTPGACWAKLLPVMRQIDT